ncbi:HsdR family type I site-specific deoxyribonuclease [Sporosarcina oncorhynchi]|uniref:Type I restriction enzyme endonuclease subunit n=1 Tax=Sporosarcina oncorhynchi TaxID=3056444 RepID=A0ABZ0L5D3_9BACL|nr:HsdR family type I site-specific deoxyribonuclease [Sporosarcina sp. T2O-4]WOV86524.1 HsdR family type I site-specific deoxyribonuclease [Sporosarcina sp. T2O-4]
MVFTNEAEFEEALINLLLSQKGWEEVIKFPTEEDLIRNWADILFQNNRDIDRLNNVPLTNSEMQQIMEKITELRTPLNLNGFINGKSISITRDNPEDKIHLGKEVSLKIYDRLEIAGGQSRYQIAQQPYFPTKSKILNDRRGDLMLLINGMPVIHIEMKRSGVSVSQAYNQIEKYANEGIYTGLFSLVQVFVAMEPEETVYFANPGPDGKFNSDFYFHWADFNNEPLNNWKDIAGSLLSIPMAHQLIGFYTVPDSGDGVLKVMRSYQYYAANAISNKVAKTKWDGKSMLGGYIWHTTGSGKTMTSFKSAQLIANSKDADKVLFLMDRIELGTQSLDVYRGFAEVNEEVQATENTNVLITKLKSSSPADTLIVTSIQKMSRIKDDEGGLNSKDLEVMRSKRIVFIIDEAHRSTFGDMLITIKEMFPSAIFFGFTGTPIHKENQRKMNTTATVFGDELHRYSIADGIRDENVLGFDPYKVLTYRDRDLRKEVALHQAKAKSEEEAIKDQRKSKIYYKFLNSTQVPMAGYKDSLENYHKGIEDYVPKSQYELEVHRKTVVRDILDNWMTLSHASKFHAIFATSSIPEAIMYYRLLNKNEIGLKVTALFDPNIDNMGDVEFKEDGLVEIIEDYNERYGQDFSIATHAKLKKDIASRLSHKKPYVMIEREPNQQIDILIVVDQMLTGFDSKWINTLYMDKLMKYDNIIQAFSRTNRLFGPEKPFGTIRYYRYPNTMERNINEAVKIYSGDKPVELFVQKLEGNLRKLNTIFEEIKNVFETAGVENFEKLPEDFTARGKFASLFKGFNEYLEASRIQGFKWERRDYDFSHGQGKPKTSVVMKFDETDYLILALRYKELFSGGGSGGESEVPFEVEGYLTEIDTGVIDTNYMNSRFQKYLRLINQTGVTKQAIEDALNDLHTTFSTLTQEEQKYANIFMYDVQSGNIVVETGKTLKDYIIEYRAKAENDQIHKFAELLGLNEAELRKMMSLKITESNINEYNRFDNLKKTVVKERARSYFEKISGKSIKPYQVNIRIDEFLRKFLLEGGFEIETVDENLEYNTLDDKTGIRY